MPLDVKTLFRDHGITIEFEGARGAGVAISADLLAQIDVADVNAKTGQRVVAGDMLTAVIAKDEFGQPKLDDAGRPKRSGGYLKLGVDNDLVILVPRADQPGEFTRVNASNTRRAAAQLIRMEREAGHEVEAIAAEHAKAVEAHAAAVARGEQVEEPVARLPLHQPEVFGRFHTFVAAAEAVIASELASGFSTVQERKTELMAGLEIRNERRNILTHEEIAKVAEARSLQEKIATLDPAHADAVRKVSGAYTGNGKAAADAVEAMQEGLGIRLAQGIPAYGPAASLLKPLMATFTSEDPSKIWTTSIEGMARRRFEQGMGRFENEEIAAVVRERVEAVMGERMPGYTCELAFFANKGADMLMVNDLGGCRLYVMDSAARTADLDLEALDRAPTKDDVPTDERLAQLRATVQELTFDNGAEIDFAFDDEAPVMEDDDDEPNF
ncbi:hypothetical protein LAZ40_06745 [Cereibacter sphaeroides]|uniref:hypothetical protein n=1 Tax=Cereibacter sphaeroides TaxID=1063 RepID=UPI001F3AD687|nr:hypothetical protein [Cereibacter sphaeroides]MCE6958744.1 hypothetical protein [Cereibacter sphaeroides]MCE6973382.1 hypothetical protein [Cereibacter sphaeroides]